MPRRGHWFAGLLLSLTFVGCGGGEEVFLRCVDVDAPTLSWFLFEFDEGAEAVRIESGLGEHMGDRGRLETTDAAYRISVSLPDDSAGRRNEFQIDRIAGNGRMLTLGDSGDIVGGTLTVTLECERVRPDERL